MADFPLQFERPMWLWAMLILIPVVWIGRQSLSGLGPWRQRIAIALRVLVLAILVLLLAGPLYARRFKHLSVMAIVDRTRSVPQQLQQRALSYVNAATDNKPDKDRIGIVYAGEKALIEALPNISIGPIGRAPAFVGDRTDLEAAIRMAMAVMPNDTAKRILLISDGNENVGDLREVAKLARANRIPIDVIPLRYDHEREVILERLIVPGNARVGQTIAVKCVLRSTGPTTGKLLLADSGNLIDLDPDSPAMAMPITLKAGLNVTTLFLPIRSGGVHRFQADFTPDRSEDDTLTANNTGVAVTVMAGRGRVLLVDADGRSAGEIMRVLASAGVDVEYRLAEAFPAELLELMEFDATVLVNVPNSTLSLAQQEMIRRYVHDIGGGLVMVGGPEAFGAGGWIGSPVEKALPVDLDPPQRQQLPKGALALIMHSCEMPNGNYWGETVAIAAVRSLSRLDLAGVIDYGWHPNSGGTGWVYPLSPVGDKSAIVAAIKKMQMGDMPDFGTGLRTAYNALIKCDAAQKHVVIISDGDPSPPTQALLDQFKAAKITVTGVAVFPHNPNDVQTLRAIARITGGRFYNVTNNPARLPRIFVKEAQTIRRPLIFEKPFTPQIVDPLSELTKGIELQPPVLNGYVLTTPKKELIEMIMVSPQRDPILAARHYGLGKTVAFTSDASSRWADNWLDWPKFDPFWEQLVRWSMRSSESPNVQVSTELQGRRAVVNVDVSGQEEDFANLLDISGIVIGPDLNATPIALQQIGPGRYQADFPAPDHGTYVVNLQCRDGENTYLVRGALAVPYAPEFRDLKDNAALLLETAQISGGRDLSDIPQQDKLFDHTSLVFPRATKPLWNALAIVWLILFLTDVAVRRVIVDLPAAWRGVRNTYHRLRGTKDTAQVVDRLRQHQLKVRKKIKTDTAARTAHRRFEPETTESPKQADIFLKTPAPEEKSPEKEEKEEKAEQPRPTEHVSYLERLKEAKKKAQDRMKEND